MRISYALALMLTAGCAGGRSSDVVSFRPSQPAPPTATASPTSYNHRGIQFTPPPGFPWDDVSGGLVIALEEYIEDASMTLGGWMPQTAGVGRQPLWIVFTDTPGQNLWNETTRTAWLEWPRGKSGRYKKDDFAPLLATVLVLDKRREDNEIGPWTTEENDCAMRGRNLPVTLLTNHPGDFE